MNIDVEQFEAFRPDAHRLVLGVLWLIAMVIVSVSTHDIVWTFQFVDSLAAAVPHLAIPPILAGVLVIVGGIIVPYALAEAFAPIGTLVMNISLVLYRRLKPGDVRFLRKAAETLASDLHSSFPPPFHSWRLYVASRSPQVGRHLIRERQGLEFRASALLPASIIVGWFVYRGIDHLHQGMLTTFLGIVVGVVVFAIGAVHNNRRLLALNNDTAVAVVLAQGIAHTQPPDSGSVSR